MEGRKEGRDEGGKELNNLPITPYGRKEGMNRWGINLSIKPYRKKIINLTTKKGRKGGRKVERKEWIEKQKNQTSAPIGA